MVKGPPLEKQGPALIKDSGVQKGEQNHEASGCGGRGRAREKGGLREQSKIG